MPKYEGPQQQQSTVDTAVRKTTLLLSSAGQRLIRPEADGVRELLSDAFGITAKALADGSARGPIATIKNVLARISSYMLGSTLKYVAKPPSAASQFACYTIPSTGRAEVFLTPKFFSGGYSTVELAAYLVHEYVHLVHWPNGHPGASGEQLAVLFDRCPLEIPPAQSVNNAYCYQYFIEWLADL